MQLAYMKLNQRGLSLIELLVVIVIIAIIASLATPMYHRWRAGQEMRDVSHVIPSLVRVAKVEAFSRKHDIVLCPSVDGQQCTDHLKWEKNILMFVDVNQNRQREADEELLLNYELNIKYAKLTRLGARHANYIMFKQSNALPQGSQGSFMYCSTMDDSMHRRIVLNSSGITRIEETTNCS